jgi:retron-type reverse transcriptase
LFGAWTEFKHGKLKKQDIIDLSAVLEENVFELHRRLKEGSYKHSAYQDFYILDPKLRHIHKAEAIDRLLHQAIFQILEPRYNRQFIFDSYSSRKEKGVHKARARFHSLAWKLSRNNTRVVWVLKCDVKKFFDSIDHKILFDILARLINDEKTLALLWEIIESFETSPDKGIPLGNLTSQLFSNVYLNELDQEIKRKWRVKNYVRYADDFVILDNNKSNLEKLLPIISDFLGTKLKLFLHPEKVFIQRFSKGIDFLGNVIYPRHQILRIKTKRRALRKVKKLKKELANDLISEGHFRQVKASYLGLLKYCRGRKIEREINGF